MLKALRRLADKAGSNWNFITWAAGAIWTLAGGTMTGWAARAAGILSAYAPFSWVVAGLGGALISALLLLIIAWMRKKWAEATVLNKMATPPVSINPLDNNFHAKRIQLSDFYNIFTRANKSKTFVDCEFMGPGIIALMNCTTDAINAVECDFILIRDGADIHNVIAFEGSIFTRCSFFKITFLMVPQGYNELKKFGVPFLTYPPPEESAVPKPAAEKSFPPPL